jgi:Flp pilus assembly protein TadG
VALPVQRVKRKAESGAALVEFGLVLLPTLGFLFLLMTLAWVIFAWACVQEGLREGTRAAVTCTPATGLNAAVQQVVEQYSFGFINSGNVSSVMTIRYYDPITLQPISGNVITGDVVKITVSRLRVYQFAPILLSYTPLYVSGSSADIMSCPSPASP